jgi:uncharacterized protein (DUF433 family)
MNPLLARTSVDPHICFDKPCIRNALIWVSRVRDILAAGVSAKEILADYPQLKREDILAGIAYADIRADPDGL